MPAVQGPLEYIAEAAPGHDGSRNVRTSHEVGIVQDLSHAALGQRKMSAEALRTNKRYVLGSCKAGVGAYLEETMLWLFLLLTGLAWA